MPTNNYFTLEEKRNFINKYTKPNNDKIKYLIDIASVFITAQIILGKDSEFFERFVNLFWKNFRR